MKVRPSQFEIHGSLSTAKLNVQRKPYRKVYGFAILNG